MNTDSKYNTKEILDGISRSDNEVLQYIYKEYFKITKKQILKNSGLEQDAEDVFQEALIIIYIKLRDPKFRLTSSFGTFLCSITWNMWLRELRRLNTTQSLEYNEMKVEEGEEILLLDETLHIDIVKSEKLKLYREKFEELSSDCQQVLRMFLNEMSPAHITEVMGYKSVQHAKNRQFRCKEFLIRKIKRSPIYTKLGYGQNTIN